MVWQTCLDNAVSDVADVVAACGTIETLDAGYTPNADLEKVLFLAEERALYPGKAPLTLTDNVESPLVRHRQQPSIRRFIAGAIAGGIGCGTAAALVDSESAITRAGATWATLALCVLVFIGIVISFVDHDTLFLDLPTLLVGGLAAWVLAVVACLNRDDTASLKAGAIVAVVWAVGLELTNLMYRILRKTNGMGFGDTLIVLVSSGVPGAVSGQPLVAFASPFAAAVLALIWHLPGALTKRTGTRTAFAFGPFLCVGWLAGWVVLHIGGIS